MLNITDDPAHNALIAEPTGKLQRADFEALTERFNAIVNTTDRIPNLVIHTRDFPGWADFAALTEHLQFIRAHQKLVDKIALVSDAKVLEIAPKVARHFITATIRRFPADDLAGALAWSAEAAPEPSHVTVMQGLPAGVVGVTVRGVINARDYAETIAPLIEAAAQAGRKIRLVYQIGREFEAYTPGAVWSDARVGLMHLSDFARVAVVSDIEWIRHAVRAFAPLIPGDVHVFANAELDAAKTWAAE
jgi:hypothetical protein